MITEAQCNAQCTHCSDLICSENVRLSCILNVESRSQTPLFRFVVDLLDIPLVHKLYSILTCRVTEPTVYTKVPCLCETKTPSPQQVDVSGIWATLGLWARPESIRWLDSLHNINANTTNNATHQQTRTLVHYSQPKRCYIIHGRPTH